MTLVELSDVTRTVNVVDAEPLHILRGVDLVLEEEERVSIVGRSGSGKSTLLNILGLIDVPTSGEMRFGDEDAARFSGRRRDRVRGSSVGFVFQQFNLLEGRTARENVETPLLYARDSTFWRRREIATDMLERVGLGHRIDALPSGLSGGEQQRVAIARALVRAPRLILADEPTGALDIETGAEVMGLIEEIAGETGASLVTITHDPAIAARAQTHYRLVEGVLTPDDFSREKDALVPAAEEER